MREALMSPFAKLFGRKPQQKNRIRVCVECGMPVEEHKEWCAILRGQQDRAQAAASTAQS
jgi:hypothetical protein